MKRAKSVQLVRLFVAFFVIGLFSWSNEAFACNERGLELCLSFGGGKACYEKHRCTADAGQVEQGDINLALGERLADAAYNGNIGYSRGLCYQYVWSALRDVLGYGIERLPVPSRSAFMFGDWVDANPSWAKRELKLERRSIRRTDAPNGSILVWEPGECGYNSIHGHIEIVVQRGQSACSDFCGEIRTGCGNPRVYVPVF